MIEATPDKSAEEHLRDHLLLVEMFISRAIRRGRSDGWLDSGAEVPEVTRRSFACAVPSARRADRDDGTHACVRPDAKAPPP